MENETNFYDHVSSWIKGYHSADGLHYLRRFVNNSHEPVQVKEQLHREIDFKYASLNNLPYFCNTNGSYYLCDDAGHPRIYTTRFAAICKVAELKLKGYNAMLQPGEVFYRIALEDAAPMNQLADYSLQ